MQTENAAQVAETLAKYVKEWKSSSPPAGYTPGDMIADFMRKYSEETGRLGTEFREAAVEKLEEIIEEAKAKRAS